MTSPHRTLQLVWALAAALLASGCGGGGDEAAAPQAGAMVSAAAVAAVSVGNAAQTADAPVIAGAATMQEAVDRALAEAAAQQRAAR